MLSGDLLGRWRYLPEGFHPIPAFGTPLRAEGDGYGDMSDYQFGPVLRGWKLLGKEPTSASGWEWEMEDAGN